jgi:hypothetical protein
MFNSDRKHLRAIATLGVASALALGGVAAAQGTSQTGAPGGQGAAGHPGGPPPIGPSMKGMTYAEFHVQRNGQSEVIRLDQGKITAVDSTSITLSENDGSSVTIALDDETKVLGKPGEESTVADLSVGQTVIVCGPEGGAAKTVMVPPKPGQMKGGPPSSGQLPSPPQGSPPGGNS